MSEGEMTASEDGSETSMSEGEITSSEERSEMSWNEFETEGDESSENSEAVEEEDLPLICSLNEGPYDPPMRGLENFLNILSSKPSTQYRVALYNVIITRPFMTRLLPLILLKEATSSSLHNDDENMLDHDAHSPDTSENDTPFSQCQSIHFNKCRFFSQSDVNSSDKNDDVCTPDDKCCFLSALARYPFRSIILANSPEILTESLSISEIDHVKAEGLQICDDTPLSDLEYIKLGAIIQGSVQLTFLNLTLPFLNVPQAFCNSLTNVQTLKIEFTRNTTAAETIVGDGGIVDGVLRNPQNQLVDLSLKATALEDHHLIALAKVLHTSKVETLNFSMNNIQSQGLVEFARLIPNIFLSSNPWERSALEVREECGTALLHAIMENPFITGLHYLNYLPQRRRLGHQLGLNRILRKLLKSSRPHGHDEDRSIPDALWPHILARVEMCREEWEKRLPVDHVDAVFSFLQKCPGIFSCRNKQQPKPFF